MSYTEVYSSYIQRRIPRHQKRTSLTVAYLSHCTNQHLKVPLPGRRRTLSHKQRSTLSHTHTNQRTLSHTQRRTPRHWRYPSAAGSQGSERAGLGCTEGATTGCNANLEGFAGRPDPDTACFPPSVSVRQVSYKSVRQASLARYGLVRPGTDLIQPGTDLIQHGTDLIPPGTALNQT